MHDGLLPPMPLSRRLSPPWGVGASLALHLLLGLSAIWLLPLRDFVAPPPDAVSVEIVTQAQFDALQTPEPVVRSEPADLPEDLPEADAPPSPAATGDAKPAQAVTHTATNFYSADILREPKMARIRQTLTTFATSERIVQLCNIEGLEQISRAEPSYAPNALVAYALSDPVSRGLTLIATGAAFRSRRNWYQVSLTCTVAPDYEGVTAFEFAVGEPIPEEKWDAAGLNAADADE